MHNFHNSQVKSLIRYFHNKKNTSQLHRIIRDTDAKYTLPNLYDLYHKEIKHQNDASITMWKSKTNTKETPKNLKHQMSVK
jgi:hypothetical protein